MVLGIYDRLLKHVSEITKYPKESLTFLLWFAAGAGSGAFLFSRGISWLFTTRAEGVLRFFFLGRWNSYDCKKRQCKAYQGERTDMYPYRNLYSPSYCPDPSGDVFP